MTKAKRFSIFGVLGLPVAIAVSVLLLAIMPASGQLQSNYGRIVLADNPVAYWTLDNTFSDEVTGLTFPEAGGFSVSTPFPSGASIFTNGDYGIGSNVELPSLSTASRTIEASFRTTSDPGSVSAGGMSVGSTGAG